MCDLLYKWLKIQLLMHHTFYLPSLVFSFEFCKPISIVGSCSGPLFFIFFFTPIFSKLDFCCIFNFFIFSLLVSYLYLIPLLITWSMQIKLLKILALLGSGDKKASEQMYTIIGDIMKRCDSTSNIGNAVLYESICCISSIYPNPKLLESAADAIAKFLKVGCSFVF